LTASYSAILTGIVTSFLYEFVAQSFLFKTTYSFSKWSIWRHFDSSETSFQQTCHFDDTSPKR